MSDNDSEIFNDFKQCSDFNIKWNNIKKNKKNDNLDKGIKKIKENKLLKNDNKLLKNDNNFNKKKKKNKNPVKSNLEKKSKIFTSDDLNVKNNVLVPYKPSFNDNFSHNKNNKNHKNRKPKNNKEPKNTKEPKNNKNQKVKKKFSNNFLNFLLKLFVDEISDIEEKIKNNTFETKKNVFDDISSSSDEDDI